MGVSFIFIFRILLETLPKPSCLLDIKIADVFTGIGRVCTQAACCHLLLQEGVSFVRQEWRKCFYFKIKAMEITVWVI